MTTEVSIFTDATNLPTFTDDDRNSIDIGSSNAIPRISIRGGVFSILGAAKTPLGTEIMCIIVKTSGTKDSNDVTQDSKRYYKHIFTGEDSCSPDCASINGVTPDSTIEKPLCTTCKNCPMQVWGSKTGLKGGKAKACKDFRRLAICIFHKDGEHAIYQLDVPTVSLSTLREYNTKITKVNNFPLDAVITSISITVPEGFTQLGFKETAVVTPEQYELVRKLRSDDLVKKIISRECASFDADEDTPDDVSQEVTKKTKAESIVANSPSELQAKIEAALKGE